MIYDKATRNSISNYNMIAREYDETFDGRFTRELKHRIVERIELKPNYKVLDVACGNGSLLDLLNRKQAIDGHGIDVSDAMIDEAKKRYPHFSFSVGNSSSLPFEDMTFDVVTVCAAFHHFSEPWKFLQEARRVLQPAGLLVLMEPYFPPVIRQLSNLLIPLMKMGDVKVYSGKELVYMMTAGGFGNVRYTKEAKHGCMIVGRKN